MCRTVGRFEWIKKIDVHRSLLHERFQCLQCKQILLADKLPQSAIDSLWPALPGKPWAGTMHWCKAQKNVVLSIRANFSSHLIYTIPPALLLTVILRPFLTRIDVYKICFLLTVGLSHAFGTPESYM